MYLGQAASYPLDTVKRRMQTVTEFQGIHAKRYKGFTSTLIQIMKSEGLRKGLFKGFSINCIRTPIGSGLSFMTYDLVQDFWKKVLKN